MKFISRSICVMVIFFAWSSIASAFQVYGEIGKKWQSLGAQNGFLGNPLNDETGTPDGVGRYNHFQGGSIYWTPDTQAHEVHGVIRDKWASLGWERSVVGYPVSDEKGTPDGIGRYSHFQGGSIYWNRQAQAYEVYGAIRDKWASLGWERSELGYPVSGEFQDGSYRRSNFQHGYIRWSPQQGVVVSLANQSSGGFGNDNHGCPDDRPCFNGAYQSGNKVIFNFSGVTGWDFYNVRYRHNGGEKQVENRSGTFTFTDTQPNRVYTLSVQGCNSHTFAESSCSAWVQESVTTR